MANFNPANWSWVDRLQGQNPRQTGVGDYKPGTDPNLLYDRGLTSTVSGGAGVDVGGAVYTAPNGGYVAPQPTNTYTGPSQADIYAQQRAAAEAKRIQAARDSFNSGRDVLNSSVNQSISDRAMAFGRGIQDWVTGYNKSQSDLDNRGINANMAKQQGMQGIMQTVGQGIKSAGTMLGNRNAGSSSASQAIADAYGKVGQQQASQVGNQYELANNQINLEQQQLSDAAALYNRRIAEDKTSIVNGIVNEAQSKIAALNEAAANASITDRMDIAGEINRIKSQAQSQLQQYDGELGKIKQAQTLEQRQAEAQRLAQAGTAPTQQFQYTTQTPGQFQNTGDFASSMPLFTYRLNKNKSQA